MFGGHKRQGRKAGLAARNNFAAASPGSSLFVYGEGFQPTVEFLRHPYVLAYLTTTISILMKMMFNGENWSLKKKGEFAKAAIEEFSLGNPAFTHREWFELMRTATHSGDFAKGAEHAEANLLAVSGLISPTHSDPLIERAREAANYLPPPADFATGMLWVTVREFLHSTFPKKT